MHNSRLGYSSNGDVGGIVQRKHDRPEIQGRSSGKKDGTEKKCKRGEVNMLCALPKRGYERDVCLVCLPREKNILD